MNKKLVILIIIVLLALGTFFFLGSALSTAVTSAVNSIAPQVTGTKVTLGSALISPFNGTGSLNDLYVGNPEGFSDGKAFSCGKAHVNVRIRSVLSDTIVIEEVIIEAPEFVYESKITSSNIGKILDNVNKFVGTSEPAAQTEGGKKIEIKRFVLEGAVVSVSAAGMTMPVPVPKMEITDIGTAKGGVLPAEAAAEVLKRVLASVSQAAVTAIAQDPAKFGRQAEDAVKKIGSGLKGLLDKSEEPKP
ncbi:MAG TPA: hypothetical protein VMM36_12585 [Opitutaceae bacterium]|nr:hypothetical protein [Opitutaceae bacterium]